MRAAIEGELHWDAEHVDISQPVEERCQATHNDSNYNSFLNYQYLN